MLNVYELLQFLSICLRMEANQYFMGNQLF
jgi:hypothetical protein